MSRHRKSNSVSQSAYVYNSLESRQLLATIALNGTELLLGGSATDDVGTVSISGSSVVASLTGAQTKSFPVSSVESIRFVGLNGDDSFTNNTSIRSFAYGQGGNDTLIGGSGIDRLFGGSGNDILTGNAGNDYLRAGSNGTKEINGGDGDDLILGDTGLNTIRGGNGSDEIYGSNLVDTIFGDAGNDFLFPGAGNNVVRGGIGNDLVIATSGNDKIYGEAGNDRIYAGGGNDEAYGGDGNDVIVGRAGNDILIGGDGNDFLRGSSGNDRLEGGNGNDFFTGGTGDDQLIGGDNTDDVKEGQMDRVLFQGREANHRVAGNLFAKDMVGDGGTDTLVGMEWLYFSDRSLRAESQIKETITIQPIITSRSDGSNTAEFFGNSVQSNEIRGMINDIWYQARIQVRWAAPNTWNNTFANVGNGGTRPTSDATRIFADGISAGVASSDSKTINIYLVEVVPGFSDTGENISNGLAIVGGNGIALHVGDNLPTFEAGREAVSRVISHEIGHNLGLVHVTNNNNLMFPVVEGSDLTSSQIDMLIDSDLSR